MPPRILIAEDDILIALGVQYALIDMGCVPVGPATTAAHALSLINSHAPHAAILDIGLKDSCGLPVADELTRRSIPFVFASGQPLPPERRAAYAGVPVLIKPYPMEAIERHLVAPLRLALATTA